MQDDILLPKILVQPLPISTTSSSQICVGNAAGTPLCLYAHEIVSLILATAILLRALATFIKAMRGDIG